MGILRNFLDWLFRYEIPEMEEESLDRETWKQRKTFTQPDIDKDDWSHLERS